MGGPLVLLALLPSSTFPRPHGVILPLPAPSTKRGSESCRQNEYEKCVLELAFALANPGTSDVKLIIDSPDGLWEGNKFSSDALEAQGLWATYVSQTLCYSGILTGEATPPRASSWVDKGVRNPTQILKSPWSYGDL